MKTELNELLTRVGPGTGCGELMRRYWQPVALVDEFNPALDPRTAARPLKPVRVLGQDMVLFQDAAGHWGLLDRHCPHRGADLAFARYEPEGIRCPFHGWKFAADGTCLETPAEPTGSTLCQHVRQRSYPVIEKAGVLHRPCLRWTAFSHQAPTVLLSRGCGNATGCRLLRWESTPHTLRFCTGFLATNRWTTPLATKRESSFAAPARVT
jgi:nitrite reductase/ring-hydroxylating ferredoxin subunit